MNAFESLPFQPIAGLAEARPGRQGYPAVLDLDGGEGSARGKAAGIEQAGYW